MWLEGNEERKWASLVAKANPSEASVFKDGTQLKDWEQYYFGSLLLGWANFELRDLKKRFDENLFIIETISVIREKWRY